MIKRRQQPILSFIPTVEKSGGQTRKPIISDVPVFKATMKQLTYNSDEHASAWRILRQSSS